MAPIKIASKSDGIKEGCPATPCKAKVLAPLRNSKVATSRPKVAAATPRSNVAAATPRLNVAAASSRSNVAAATPRSNVAAATSRSKVAAVTPRSNVAVATPRSNVAAATSRSKLAATPRTNVAATSKDAASRDIKLAAIKNTRKYRPKPAHSGVPVPEKLKKLLEKQLREQLQFHQCVDT